MIKQDTVMQQKGDLHMAGRDGTGPNGKGPNTGRGKGPCKPTKPVKKGNTK